MSKAIVARYKRLTNIEEKAYRDKRKMLEEYGEKKAKFPVGTVVWHHDDNHKRRYYRITENLATIHSNRVELITRAVPTTRSGERRGHSCRLGDVTLSMCVIAAPVE